MSPPEPKVRVKRSSRSTELYRELGYDDFNRSRDRPHETLKRITCDFRKDYQFYHLGGASFPLDPNDPLVKKCVVGFLDDYSQLFKASDEAINSGWPIITIAEDKAKIVTILSKLFCQQELNFQHNQGTKRNKQQHNNHRDAMDSGGDTANDCEASEDEVASCTGHESAYDADSMGTSILDTSEVRENIQIHLDYVYPLDQPRVRGRDSWIISSNLDISEIDPFLIASLHELSLYHFSHYGEELKKLNTLVEWLKDNSLVCAQARKARLLSRVEGTIDRLVPELIRCGFLVEIDGVVRKGSEFEGAWRLRRHEYIDKHHGGSLNGVIGFKFKPLSPGLGSHPHQPKSKRKSKSSTSKSRITVTSCPLKRQKVYDTDTDYEVPDDDDAPRFSRASRTETRDKCTENMTIGHAEPPESSQQLSSKSKRGPCSTFMTPYSPPDTPQVAPQEPMIGTHLSTAPTDLTSLNNDCSITVAAPGQPSPTIPEMKVESDISQTRDSPTTDNSNVYDVSRASTPDVVFISENRVKSPSTPPTAGDCDIPLVKSESVSPSVDTPSNLSETVNEPNTAPSESASRATITSISAAKLPTPTSPTPEAPIPKRNMEFSLLAERRSTPYDFTGSATSLEPLHLIGQTLNKAALSQQTEPLELTLQFAIEDENCVNDDEPSSLVSLRSISSLDVKDLFILVTQRSGRSPNALTFTTQWQEVENMVVLVVRQSAGEGAWERVKRRLDAILKNEKRVYRGKRVPELVVWVSCGDRTKVDGGG